jgi:tetratricopeptide (TPR) repeat protein
VDRKALLIATDTYDDPELSRLRAPAHDVRALAEVLADPRIGDYDVLDPVVNRPSHEVRTAIDDFFADASSQHTLVLYISGHGRLGRKRLYFATTDTKTDRLASTAIDDHFVIEAMESSHSHRVVLLLDCCHSGKFGKGLRPFGAQVGIEGRFDGRGHMTLTASDELEYAYEELRELEGLEERPSSLFTRALVEGLKTGAADRNGDGHVSVDELYEYIRDETEHVQQALRTGTIQGDLLFANNPRPPAPAPPVAAPPARAAAATRAASPAITSQLRRAWQKQARGQHEEALADYIQAVQQAPNSSEALAGRGWARLQLNMHEQAGDDLERALAIDPDDTLALTGRGRLRALRCDLTGAKADLDRALKLDPELTDAYLARGFAAMRGGAPRPDAAEADFARALELQPDLPDALVGSAMVTAARGRPAEGVPLCDQALKLAPQHALALAVRGALKGSALEVDRAVELAPAACEVGLMRATTMLGLGRFDDARNEYDRVMKLGPDRFTPLMGRGFAAMGKREPEEALNNFEWALRVLPDSPVARAHVGVARLELGDAEAALADLEAAIAANPDVLGPGGAQIARGRAHLALGHHDAARADFKRARGTKNPAAAAWQRALDEAITRAKGVSPSTERRQVTRNHEAIQQSDFEKGWFIEQRQAIIDHVTGSERLLWLGRCGGEADLLRTTALLLTSEQLVWCRKSWIGEPVHGALRWEDVRSVEPLPNGVRIHAANGDTLAFTRLGQGVELQGGAARGPEQAVALVFSLSATARDRPR